MALELSVVTPQGPVVEAQVDSVVGPGQEGEFGVLTGHEKFLIPLSPGVLRYRQEGQESVVAVASGFAEITAERVIVLVDSAERPDQIDPERARTAKARAEEGLRELGRASPEQLEAARADLARAEARLSVSARSSSTS